MTAPKPAEPPLPPPWPFPTRPPEPMTDERIDYIADLVVKGMPDGLRGFCKTWGWRQFARALLHDCRATIGACVWSDEGESWSTGCGRRFTLEAGTPLENGMRYCCYCGRAVSDFTNEAHG